MINILEAKWNIVFQTPLNIDESDIFILEYCRKGSANWEGGQLPCKRLEKGDLLVCNELDYLKINRSLDYEGECILFNQKSEKSIKENFGTFDISLKDIALKFKKNTPFIIQSKDEIENAFVKKIGNSAEQNENLKFRLLQILLMLKNLDIQKESVCQKCNITSLQMDKIYGIRSFICKNIDSHFTIEELSQKFEMPATAMKVTFKNVFGLPVFTYARRERMKYAATQLRKGNRGILEIAGTVGYNNGSKFAHAFSDVMGMTPKEYRRRYKESEAA